MKLIITTLLALSSLALGFPLKKLDVAASKRDTVACDSSSVYNGEVSVACGNLQTACIASIGNGISDMWSVPSCVAAATCRGTQNLTSLAECTYPDFSIAEPQWLNYNIWASITGECAWDNAGCAMTFQNYADFIYATLTEIGSTDWPESVEYVQSQWWDVIASWISTGETVTYLSFVDWLRYSD